MYPLQINKSIFNHKTMVLTGLFLCIMFLFSGCGFFDFSTIGLTTVPSNAYEVLPHASSHIILRFDTDMMEKETENAVQIISPFGNVDGEYQWHGRDMHFIPTASWLKGIRYVLSIKGNVYSKDGRDSYFSREIPFYAMDNVPLPYLVSFYPADGASTETFLKNEVMLSLKFSMPMDRFSTELAFNCSGTQTFEWLEDDTILNIKPDNNLSSWTLYRWSLSDKALSRDGSPIVKAVSGTFITDIDDIFPEIVRVIPLFDGNNSTSTNHTGNLWGSWIPYDINLDNGLLPGHVIGVEFSKAMDPEKLRNSFSFEPLLYGRLEIISPYSAVYIPDRNPDPETFYTLTISGDIRDKRGLRMGEDYKLVFSSDIPFLRINSLIFDDAPLDYVYDPVNAGLYKIYTEKAENGAARFTIRFTLPFSIDAQIENTQRISLMPFFPHTLAPVNLRFVKWLSSDLLRMEWEGLTNGTINEPHYYRLVLPGGRSGITNGSASYLKEENYFYFEAVNK